MLSCICATKTITPLNFAWRSRKLLSEGLAPPRPGATWRGPAAEGETFGVGGGAGGSAGGGTARTTARRDDDEEEGAKIRKRRRKGERGGRT